MVTPLKPFFMSNIFRDPLFRWSGDSTYIDYRSNWFSHPTIRIYDRDGNLVKQIDPSVQGHPIVELTCEVVEHGCGTFTLKTEGRLEEYLTDVIADEDDGLFHYRIAVNLYGEFTPCYVGLIYEEEFESETNIYTYRGYGLMEQLKSCIVYDSGALSIGGRLEFQTFGVKAIVETIMEDHIALKTDILFSKNYIQNPTYTLQYYVIDHDQADKVIDDLARIATSWTWYIDTLGYMHFFDDSDYLQSTVIAGKDFGSIKLTKDWRDIRNVFHIKLGLWANGLLAQTNLLGDGKISYTYSAPSVAAYGTREAVINAPGVFHEDDAWRTVGLIIKGWAAAKAAERSEPTVRATISNVILDHTVPCLGNVRVLTSQGRSWDPAAKEYTLALKRIQYQIDGRLGVQVSWELGEVTSPLSDVIVELLRRVADNAQMVSNDAWQI